MYNQGWFSSADSGRNFQSWLSGSDAPACGSIVHCLETRYMVGRPDHLIGPRKLEQEGVRDPVPP